MRIALVADTFGTTVKAVVDHLVDTGHQVVLIAPAPGPASYRGCRVERMTSDGLGSRVRDALRTHQPDLVHVASSTRLGRKALGHAQKLGLATLLVQHAPDPRLRADRVLVTATWLRDQLGAPASVWAPGVDARAFAPHLRDDRLHDTWSRRRSPEGPRVVVGFVGHLHKRHGVRDLAELAGLPGTRLVVVGDGPQRDWLTGRLPGARFTGELETGDLTRALASLDVVVHPGTQETCAHALREAAASGVPVVAPRAGGAIDVVRPLETGLLYDPEDPRALRRAVTSMVADRQRHLLGARARELASLRDWPTAVTELVEDHYRPLLGGTGSPYAA